MEKLDIQKQLAKVQNASPLEMATVLQEVELWDKKTTRQVVDEIYAEFESGKNLQEEIVTPIFTSIVDGLMEALPATRKLRQKGVTASRIVKECKAFQYNSSNSQKYYPDGYVEWKNIQEMTREEFEQYSKYVRLAYDRKLYEDKAKLNDYKEKAFKNNGNRINATDEYTGKKNIYKEQAHPDARRNVITYKHGHQAVVDHIVPLKEVYDNLKGNYALSDEDIKNIANQDSNYALTSAMINGSAGCAGMGGKSDMTNAEFVEDQRRREREGLPNLGLSEETKQTLIQMEIEAQKEIDKNANKAIAANLVGQGTGDTADIWEKTLATAGTKAKDYAVGNLIMFLVKPLYYEVSDIMLYGLKDGVQAESSIQAIKFRFGRVKDYVIDNAWPLLKDNFGSFIKNLLSSLIEGIISLFIGIFKQILKVVKEGIKVFVSAGKVLFGKDSANKTSAEKGDAIIKILGGCVVALTGVGVEALLNKIGVGSPWDAVISTIISGIASATFMYALDKLDLFSAKAEKRAARIEDIFNERVKDIQEAQQSLNKVALQTLLNQQRQFDTIHTNIKNALTNNDLNSLNSSLYKMADLMNVKLSYSNTQECMDYLDSEDEMVL